MFTNFNNSFTVAFYNELQKKALYNPISPQIICCITLLLHDFTQQLFIQKCEKSFTYSKYLERCYILDHMSVSILSIRSKYPSSAHTHTLRHACHFVNGCVNDALLQCCDKRVAGTDAIYCADMMSLARRKGN